MRFVRHWIGRGMFRVGGWVYSAARRIDLAACRMYKS